MPQAKIDDTLTMSYEVDDYTDPWTQPEILPVLIFPSKAYPLAATMPDACADAVLSSALPG